MTMSALALLELFLFIGVLHNNSIQFSSAFQLTASSRLSSISSSLLSSSSLLTRLSQVRQIQCKNHSSSSLCTVQSKTSIQSTAENGDGDDLNNYSNEEEDDDDEDGMMLTNNEIQPIIGENWMKRSSSIDFMPAEMTNSNSGGQSDDQSIYMDVGINGNTFGTAELSRRMHEAMMKVGTKKFPGGVIPNDLREVYLLYAMDASAKEAVKVAMDSNGYALNLGKDEAMQDEGAWGQIDNVVLLDPITGQPTRGDDGSNSYNSFVDAISKGGWEPGEGYSFVVREVPARKKAMDLEALLRALDPDGTLWDEAKKKGILLPGEEIGSLKELAMDCEQRVKTAPFEATDETSVFRGGTSKGYNVIARSALQKRNRNEDGTENDSTLLHVMDSLANHGCLIVDLTDGDTSIEDATVMSKMWETTALFFDKVMADETMRNNIPSMQQAEGVGSSHAMVGFASFKDGDNQFLETRVRRSDGALLPSETCAVVGEGGVRSLIDAFRVMAEVGKDIVRIATAASSVDVNAFATSGSSSILSQEEEGSPSIAGLSFEEASISGFVDEGSNPSQKDMKRAKMLASDAALLLTEEIIDDGKPLLSNEIKHNEGPVSMSPHRMCRYSNSSKSSNKKENVSEIFGAHTDTSFVTIVPAAKVSGLEVFDEDSLQWYRPELNARKHAKKVDPTGNKDLLFPWHSRYLVVMPGELLQLTSRNNIPAAVHRVVATVEAPRLSAPVLLRARPGTEMNVERYMGSLDKADDLLMGINGMKMEEIHDALQQSSKP